jgi:hypothetical protein
MVVFFNLRKEKKGLILLYIYMSHQLMHGLSAGNLLHTTTYLSGYSIDDAANGSIPASFPKKNNPTSSPAADDG